MSKFVHLINHSEYSMVRSRLRPCDIVDEAVRDSAAAAAITDRGNMAGALEFLYAALKAGVKPILGCELVYEPGEGVGVSGPDGVVLLAENDEGYRNLIDLVSEGCLNDRDDEPVVGLERMAERCAGLFAIYGGRRSHFGRALLKGNAKLAKERVDALRGLFDHDRFFLTIQDGGAPDDKALIAKTAEFADAEGIQLVATDDCRGSVRKGKESWQRVRRASRNGRKGGLPAESGHRTADEMELLFRDRPDAIENAAKIAEACNVENARFMRSNEFWPKFRLPEGFADADEYLAHLVWERAPKRWPGMSEAQRARIRNELDVMKKKHVADYMLVAQELVAWARERGMPVAPGCHRTPGSAVAYVLGVTDVDPFRFGLLFERFLNPERVSSPDMAVELPSAGPALVAERLAELHGRDCVAKVISRRRHPGSSLDFMESFVVSSKPLRDLAPLCRVPGTTMPAVQYDEDVAYVGVLKLDFFGLPALTAVAEALEAIKENHGVEVDLESVALDDAETLELFREGKVEGVSGFESPGMQMYLRDLRPADISDLVVVNALFRPALIGLLPDFIRRRRGEESYDCFDPRLEGVLGETCGLILYQEQVMEIARRVAGFSLGEADNLRRALAKRRWTEAWKRGTDAIKEKFEAGALERGFGRAFAAKIWNELLDAGNRAFSKSHAAGRTMLAFRSAYLKARWPAEFMAASVNADAAARDFDYVAMLLRDCRMLGVEVVAPRINESGARSAASGGRLVRGLAGVRSVGAREAETIVAEREKNGPFDSVEDFAERMSVDDVLHNETAEALEDAGAFEGQPRFKEKE